jgi:hypothetical protein
VGIEQHQKKNLMRAPSIVHFCSKCTRALTFENGQTPAVKVGIERDGSDHVSNWFSH